MPSQEVFEFVYDVDNNRKSKCDPASSTFTDYEIKGLIRARDLISNIIQTSNKKNRDTLTLEKEVLQGIDKVLVNHCKKPWTSQIKAFWDKLYGGTL